MIRFRRHLTKGGYDGSNNGVPAEADSGRDVRTYALERLGLSGRGKSVESLAVADSDRPPKGLDVARIEDAADLPFSMYPAEAENAAHVHVRFAPEQARFVFGRRWHTNQTMRWRRDGGLDIRFGPADVREAAGWIRQWGRGVTVLGDASVIRAAKRSQPISP